MTQLFPGPCVICGLTNYELSCGGPAICPTCDCGYSGPQLVERQRAEIERLRAAIQRAGHSLELGRCSETVARELRGALGVEQITHDKE